MIPAKPNCYSLILAFAFAMGIALSTGNAVAQSDVVYLYQAEGARAGKQLSGQITDMSKDKVVIKTRNRDEEVPAQDIRRIKFAGESNDLSRAKERMADNRFADCIEELAKIDSPPSRKIVKQDIAFLEAYSVAQLALLGVSGTANEAGSKINAFVQQNNDSYHFYPATEVLGQLFMAIGNAELASKEFATLSQSSWPEYQAKGMYLKGQTEILLNKPDEAKKTFAAIGALPGNDDMTQEYKLIATCQLARIASLGGDAQAIKAIQNIIKTENAETRKLLFANAYNALGAIHEKQNNLKDAAKAYLHTELLYADQSDPHAEALFKLSQIWRKLGETDRASRARSKLQSRYRNNYWTTKL